MNKNEKFVITINRELGSGGRTIGRLLSEKLGVPFYDKAVIDGLTQKFGLSPERIEEIKAQKKSWWNDINTYYQTLVNSANMPMEAEVKLDNRAAHPAGTGHTFLMRRSRSYGLHGVPRMAQPLERLHPGLNAAPHPACYAPPECQRTRGSRHHCEDGYDP